MTQTYNYTKAGEYYKRHHARYQRRVENMRPQLICQDCHGEGGETDVILEDGSGPWEECGWCEGTGLVLPHRRGEWLRLKKDIKHDL